MPEMIKQRPGTMRLIDAVKYRLPVAGVVSILHRASGALLFLCLPLLLWMLQYSLRSIDSFTELSEMLQHPISKLALIVILWALLHHLCAGIRYLALDLDYGVKLAQARASSRWVLAVSLTLTLILGVRLW